MHEMSIALSIIDLAADQAKKAAASKIVEIELDIGTMSGIEIEALNYALEIAVKDSVLEFAEIKINRIEAVSECLECGHIFVPEGFIYHCPECSNMNTRIFKGKEMQVKSILVDYSE